MALFGLAFAARVICSIVGLTMPKKVPQKFRQISKRRTFSQAYAAGSLVFRRAHLGLGGAQGPC